METMRAVLENQKKELETQQATMALKHQQAESPATSPRAPEGKSCRIWLSNILLIELFR